MANEVTVQSGLQIYKTPLTYFGQPTAFRADMTGTFGPTPGAIVATTAGADVDLSALDVPGFCRIMNLDSVNFVTFGMWDPDNSIFLPVFEVGPGESYVHKLSRYIGEEFQGVSTGTGTANNRLRAKADTSACNIVVEAFER